MQTIDLSFAQPPANKMPRNFELLGTLGFLPFHLCYRDEDGTLTDDAFAAFVKGCFAFTDKYTPFTSDYLAWRSMKLGSARRYIDKARKANADGNRSYSAWCLKQSRNCRIAFRG